MIASFKEIASAMKRCVSIIDDYTRLSPSSLPEPIIKPSLVPTPSGEVKKERKQRTTKPKDPNAPKRPPSPYILFQNEVREGMRKSNPEMPYKDLLGAISLKWKDLPENQKKVCLAIDSGPTIVDGKCIDRCSRRLTMTQMKNSAWKRQITTRRTRQSLHVHFVWCMRSDAYPSRQPATPQTVQTPTVVRAQVSPDSDSDATSDDSDTDSQVCDAILSVCGDVTDSYRFQPAPPVAIVHTIVPPIAPIASASKPITPVTVAAAEVKKEKKRKTKEDEAAVAATLEPMAEKKVR